MELQKGKEKPHSNRLVNAMLDNAGLSKEWWGEAVLTATHVLNRVPRKNNEVTPFEEWEKKKLNLSYLHI